MRIEEIVDLQSLVNKSQTDALNNQAKQLKVKKAQDPDLPVVVRGDGATQYKNVVDVLALLGQLNITQLGLVTQRLVK